MAGLWNVWICAHDLQLIRADRIVSLLIPAGRGYGAVPADDPSLHRHGAVHAEVSGGTDGDTLTRVKLADCGETPPGHLLAGLATALGSAAGAEPADVNGCLFIYARHDADGQSRWITARQLPAPWPQGTWPAGQYPALTSPTTPEAS